MKKISDHVAEIEVIYRPSVSNKPIIKSSYDAFTEILPFYKVDTIALQEQFLVMYLNRCGRIIGVYPMSKGGITGTVADIRIIFSVALKTTSTALILAHNHPSGNLTPSTQDLTLTNKIKDAGRLMDILLQDHLIISPHGSYLSMADEGII